MYDFLKEKDPNEQAGGHSWVNFLLGLQETPWVARQTPLPDTNKPAMVDQNVLNKKASQATLDAMQAPIQQFVAEQAAKKAAMGDPTKQPEVYGLAPVQMAPKTQNQQFDRPADNVSNPGFNPGAFFQVEPVKPQMSAAGAKAYAGVTLGKPTSVPVSGAEKKKAKNAARFDNF